jgi:hypothetical protein
MEQPMTPRTWFTLALRIIGVWVAIDGIDQLAAVVNIKFGFSSPVTTQLPAFLIHGALKILIAFVVLRGAPLISSYFYAAATKASTNDGGE